MSKHSFNKSKLGFRLFVLKKRISSIRKDIFVLAIVSFASIFLIELWLINIPAPYNFFHTIGNIYLKLCYSFFSAFLFYYLVIHLPKEKRKLKVFRQISNKISVINLQTFSLINTVLGGEIDPKGFYEIKAECIAEACKKINPNTSVSAKNFESPALAKINYNNWFDYLNDSILSIKAAIRDVLILNESVDTNLLEALTHLDDTARWLIYKNRPKTTNLEFANHHLNQLKNESYVLFKTFRKFYGGYAFEYHAYERKKNLELIEQQKL
jgi:hypothetical protein